MSADINRGLNCSSPSDPRVAAVCGVIGAVSGCNVDDVAKKRWLRMYWGSDDQCNEGFWPKEWPGIMEQVLCCDASEKTTCNAPGSAAPAVRCFETALNYSSGPCSNQMTTYSVCAVNQEAAAMFDPGTLQPAAFDCPSSVTKFCSMVGSVSVSSAS